MRTLPTRASGVASANIQTVIDASFTRGRRIGWDEVYADNDAANRERHLSDYPTYQDLAIPLGPFFVRRAASEVEEYRCRSIFGIAWDGNDVT